MDNCCVRVCLYVFLYVSVCLCVFAYISLLVMNIAKCKCFSCTRIYAAILSTLPCALCEGSAYLTVGGCTEQTFGELAYGWDCEIRLQCIGVYIVVCACTCV